MEGVGYKQNEKMQVTSSKIQDVGAQGVNPSMTGILNIPEQMNYEGPICSCNKGRINPPYISSSQHRHITYQMKAMTS